MQKIIGVIGGSFVEQKYLDLAFEVGRLLAQKDIIIVCGGLGGVMEAVCKGASENDGLTVGLLPASDIKMANPYVKIPLATGMGSARNKIIVESSQALIAIAGAYGTLSEIALALDTGKKVIGLGTWDIPGVIKAGSAKEAVNLVLE
ncbi:MAG: TIGR00725 family protein [candidate division Zixibacteria bacterium]|nr:TIGR00725 family protein [candidate division Zixibacteria bacterium]